MEVIKMNCPNVKECMCPKLTCPNHGNCCKCVIKHRETNSLPYCLFPDNNGDKSNRNHYEVLKKRFENPKWSNSKDKRGKSPPRFNCSGIVENETVWRLTFNFSVSSSCVRFLLKRRKYWRFFPKFILFSKIKFFYKKGLSNKFALRWLSLSKPPHLV